MLSILLFLLDKINRAGLLTDFVIFVQLRHEQNDKILFNKPVSLLLLILSNGNNKMTGVADFVDLVSK